jgi:hypothetical protein
VPSNSEIEPVRENVPEQVCLVQGRLRVVDCRIQRYRVDLDRTLLQRDLDLVPIVGIRLAGPVDVERCTPNTRQAFEIEVRPARSNNCRR